MSQFFAVVERPSGDRKAVHSKSDYDYLKARGYSDIQKQPIPEEPKPTIAKTNELATIPTQVKPKGRRGRPRKGL